MSVLGLHTQPIEATGGSDPGKKFAQLDGDLWPAPNAYRSASGAPGPGYWQQKVDYKIDATLDEPARLITGTAQISYHNRSPDRLSFLWFLLDQNAFRRDAAAELSRVVSRTDPITITEVRRLKRLQSWTGGYSRLRVTEVSGTELAFTVIETVMRVDLPEPVAPGAQIQIRIEWSVAMPETDVIGDRSGYECFTGAGERGDCIFHAAQWFPRLAPYTDDEGWHNQPFLVDGEFDLEFGDYDVTLTVPESHVVAATGELQNPAGVLAPEQRKRLAAAAHAVEPVYVVTPEEAAGWRKRAGERTKSWHFKAVNVRDFAFASSPTFIWDALGVPQKDPDHPLVMAMSFYPNQARPLWSAYATKAIAHTLRVFGEFAFPYPYAVVQAVNGPVNATEFPMITCINLRPTKDRKTGALTYSEDTKRRMVGLIIHEVGHNWFPMVVNSDERRWMWMDEGLTSFLQFEAEKRWDPHFPSKRGEPDSVLEYMRRPDESPIMTAPDIGSDLNNANYRKPAVALVVLRETVLGREVFDRAFKEYARRWRFKRATPYDFFRTIEEVAGQDLDWFWRGWFYSTDHVDVSLVRIDQGRLDTHDPQARGAEQRQKDRQQRSVTRERNAADRTLPPPSVEADPALHDFYSEFDRYAPTPKALKEYSEFTAALTDEERRVLQVKDYFYRFTFRNVGGLITPLILKLDYADGSSETLRIPAQVWRRNTEEIMWQYVTSKTLVAAELDPGHETADVERLNNRYLRAIDPIILEVSPGETQPDDLMRLHNRHVAPESLRTLRVEGEP